MHPKPPSFNWFIKGRIAAMGRPCDLRTSLEFFKDEGIEVIVSLTERPLTRSLVEEFGFEYHHLPVRDFSAPTLEQMAEFVEIVGHAAKEQRSVAVHCFAGKGRTGTMLAAYLVSQGRAAEAAIDEVRRQRPGSIESPEQEAAVQSYEDSLRKQRG